MRSVRTENGSGGSSPGCRSTAAQSIVLPSSRGGVPVLSRPSAKPARSSVRERPSAGASPTRPAGICRSPIWMSPRRKVPVVSTTAPAPNSRPSVRRTPVTRRPATRRSSTSPAIDRQVGHRFDRRLHGRGIELAVGLGARAAHRRALAAVEHAELDAAGVRHAAHEAVERVDLAHEMALSEPADRRIARHGADGRGRCVTRAVRAPMRAAAAAASQPAWPPPTTITSYRASIGIFCVPKARWF